MNLLSKFTPKHWVSRAKTLLKRRKKAVRSRPISNKKLKQEVKHFNYAKQYKALQIQKELDKRKYASQHINELMDQIFYPDVTLANEQAMKINMQIQVLKQYKASQSDDELEQVINENVAASQLIDIYENNSQQFTVSHFSALFSQLSKYFNKRDKIKERIEKKWNKMNQNLKKNNSNYKQKKCPYIFIDRDDVYHYQPWNRLLEGTYQYFYNVFSNQPKIQQQRHQYWEQILAFSNIVQDIHRGVGLIPVKYYQKIEQLIQKLPEQKLLQMPLKICSNLLRSLSLKDNIRFEAYSRIEQPQLNKISQSSKIITSLITRLLTDPEASTPQFQNVLTTLKSGVIIFNQEIQKSVKPAILSNLSNLPFQRVVEILTLYLRYNPNIESEFIELIKFDALRKCPMAVDKRSLFKCMNLVRKRYIQSKNMEVANPIFGYDLIQGCISVVCSKYFGSNQLNYNEILQLIDIFYDNSVSNINFLQFLASQLVKIRQQTSLQQMTSSVFRLFLLGYRSPVLSRILYEEHKKRYREAVARVKQQEIKLLQGQTEKKNPLSKYEQQDKTPIQQVLLQQDLIISIWLLFLTNCQQSKMPVSIDQLMQIYPISINSKHPLIYEICLNLNKVTKSMAILWQIKCRIPTKRTNNLANRLDKFYEHNLANPILKAMMVQAEESNQFVYNYHVKSIGNKFIRQPWSDAFCYGVQQYLSYISKNNGVNYFNREQKISEKLGKLRDQALKVGERRAKQGKQQRKTTGNVGEQYYKLQ